jgi:hypothetical protein
MTAPESVLIRYTSPDGATQIDITDHVVFADAYFELQAAAVPGSFHLTVKDPDRTLGFDAGGVIELWVGTVKMFGGFVTVPTKDFFFPADSANRPGMTRRWSLDGVDFNLLLDKRVLRNPSDYTHAIPKILRTSGHYNDEYIIGTFSSYFDLAFSGGNTLDVFSKVSLVNDFSYTVLTGTVSKSSGSVTITGSGTKFLEELDIGNLISIAGGGGTDVLTVATIASNTSLTVKTAPTHSASGQQGRQLHNGWTWPTQGSTMREVLDALVIETTIYGGTACVYWVDGNAALNWVGLQQTVAPWGFSDIPDPVASPTPFIGWRDGAASEDGSSVINDVFVWGGSPLGSGGTVKVAHKWNDTSILEHGRWQMAENHPGEDGYKSQGQVNARANALISGTTSGTSPVTGAQGLVNPDTQYTLTWFAHDVPMDGGVRQHLIPGNVTTLNLWSFSEDNGATPYAIDVPLRQVRITFPTLPSTNPGADGLAYVQFEGTFGLQMADPVWWWAFLRTVRPAPQPAPIVTTNNNSTIFPYGSYFTGTPQETPDGVRKVFSIIPTYQPGSLEVEINGIPQTPDSAFWETNPSDTSGGTFTFSAAPVATDTIVCRCRTG